MKKKVVHIITSLDIGGANMMLYKLLANATRQQFDQAVIVLMDKGKLGESIEGLGIPVYNLDASPGRISLQTLGLLYAQIRQLQPDLILAWTYHSNLAASILAPFLHKVPVVWNIRHTPYDLNSYKKLTSGLIRYGKWLSWQPVCTIYNSEISARRHRQIGYRCRREAIIPNGFEVEKFVPSTIARLNLRSLLALDTSASLIGMVARYHPMKDHANFIKAASSLRQQRKDVHFVLVGRDIDDENIEIREMVKSFDLSPQMHLLGERSDIPEITAGFDIATLTSGWGDAFPNVIGEAMACGVPCVVTDIGDSAQIVAGTGVVVPPRDSEALANAWNSLLDMNMQERNRLGEAARQRIVQNFSLPKVVNQYESLYLEEIQQ